MGTSGTRTILIHVNVEVPGDDHRSRDEIVAAVLGSIEVGSDDDSVRDLKVTLPLVEEV